MPLHAVGNEREGYVRYGESGKKYEYGPNKRFKTRSAATAAARRQSIAINLSQEQRGETPEWDKP